MTPADALVAMARGFEASGAAGLWGGLGLLRLAHTPAERAPWSAALTRASAAALALGSLAALLGQTEAMAGGWRDALDPSTLGGVLTGTGFGRSMVIRLLAAGAAAGLAGRTRAPGGRAAVAVAGGVALATLAWSGHGAADLGGGDVRRGWLHAGGDIAHLLAGGAWLGALASLVLLAAARPPAPTSASPAAAAALEAFSGVGVIVVGVLAVSGLLNAWFLVGPSGWTSLAEDAWGWLLLLKLGVFVAMLALAALNRWRWTPALVRSADGAREAAALRALRLSVAAEAALGLVVLAAAAVMGGLTPPVARG